MVYKFNALCVVVKDLIYIRFGNILTVFDPATSLAKNLGVISGRSNLTVNIAGVLTHLCQVFERNTEEEWVDEFGTKNRRVQVLMRRNCIFMNFVIGSDGAIYTLQRRSKVVKIRMNNKKQKRVEYLGDFSKF
jgi:hypothetical protein